MALFQDYSLLVFIGLVVLTATGGGIFRPGLWYDSLERPSWTPPDWAFPVAWTALYAMIAVSGWMVWDAAGPGEATLPMALFGIQLVLNFLWSAIFFGLKRIGLALLEVSLLWLSIIGMIVTFYPIAPGAAYLLVPYLVWVTFAAALNFAIWRRNPPEALQAV